MSKRIPLAGVIGQPIEHSLSPRLHGHWLKRYGIQGHYIPMNIRHEDLERVLRTLPAMGFIGLNVTIPHKEAVLALADLSSDRAALIGAANTLIFREDGKIHADNTDGYGFVANLRQYAPDWQPSDGGAAVIGAGGASRAVIAALIDLGVTDIRLSNRSRPRAEGLRAEFGPKITVYDWNMTGDMFPGAATVVNTTALGMDGNQPLCLPYDKLERDAVVTDLVYTPLRTHFLEQAALRGCRTVDWLGMLLHQGTPGFERWFGQRPEVDEDLRLAVLGG